MNIFKAFLAVFILGFLCSCKNENSAIVSQFSDLESQAEKESSDENLNKLFIAYADYVQHNKPDTAAILPVLSRAYEMSKFYDKNNQAIGFLMTTIRYESDPDKAQEKILELIDLMESQKKSNASRALKFSFVEAYPDHTRSVGFKTDLPAEFTNLEAYIRDLAVKIFEDAGSNGINRNAALRYVDACEAFALVLPDHANAPQYLYKASEISQTLRTPSKTMSIYDWLIERYPSYDKSANALFLKAYLLAEEYERKDEAAKHYQDFLENYPEHQLASSAKFLLENIGKSDAEIYDMITKKNAAKDSIQ